MALAAQNSLNSIFTGDSGPMYSGFILHSKHSCSGPSMARVPQQRTRIGAGYTEIS